MTNISHAVLCRTLHRHRRFQASGIPAHRPRGPNLLFWDPSPDGPKPTQFHTQGSPGRARKSKMVQNGARLRNSSGDPRGCKRCASSGTPRGTRKALQQSLDCKLRSGTLDFNQELGGTCCGPQGHRALGEEQTILLVVVEKPPRSLTGSSKRLPLHPRSR